MGQLAFSEYLRVQAKPMSIRWGCGTQNFMFMRSSLSPNPLMHDSSLAAFFKSQSNSQFDSVQCKNTWDGQHSRGRVSPSWIDCWKSIQVAYAHLNYFRPLVGFHIYRGFSSTQFNIINSNQLRHNILHISYS